jgi:tRNA modification GTPase
MNILFGEDRSIVTSTPGTTRDTIDEYINLRGIPIRLTDTAGMRNPRGVVEKLGIERTRKSILSSDIVIHIIDSSRRLSKADIQFSALYKSKSVIIVINKVDKTSRIDLGNIFHKARIIKTSCTTGFGIESLKDAIEEEAWRGTQHGLSTDFIINDRHSNAIKRALDSLHQGLRELEHGKTLDIVAQSYRYGLSAIGEIVGKTSTEDLLSSIFSNFCIGK